MADTHREHREKQRRSSRACKGCRINKTKCEPVPGRQECKRCLANSSRCHFLVSRRGRIKGSKNLRTLEKLSQSHNGMPSHAQPISPAFSTGSPLESTESPRSYREESVRNDSAPNFLPEASRQSGRRGRPGTSTPWDPQNLAVQKELHSGPNRATLGRSLLQILGEFPVDNCRHEKEPGECRDQGPQEPLWLLAGLADRGWGLDDARGQRARPKQSQDSLGELSIHTDLEELLRKWTPKALQEVEREQRQYFGHGMFASRCDVAPALDPINHGLVTEDRAAELFDVYWNTIHPQWAILDPALHNPTSVRQRSALLTTTILALGSTADLVTSSKPNHDRVTEALRLHAHAEKVSLVVYATGARSVDIVQAQILLSRWGTAPRSRLEEQRWMRAGMIPRMALEIGLARPPPPASNEEDAAKISQLRENDLRTRVFLIINECRFSMYNGRQALDMDYFELNNKELQEITSNDDGGPRHAPPAALYDLFLFDRDTRRRISEHDIGRHSSQLDAELEHIRAYIEGWIEDWSPGEASHTVNWYLNHEAISCWLLLVTYIAKVRLQRPCQQHKRHQQHQQQLMSNLAVRLFVEALKVPHAVCTTQRAAIFPFAASIVLRLSSRRDLVLQVALRMAGEPSELHVPTFVREAGIQMLLMLYRNNSNNDNSKAATSEDQHEDDVHSGTTEAPDASSDSDHTQRPPTFPEGVRLPEIVENNPGFFQPDHWLNGASLLQPTSLEGTFSLNVDDFPNLPDMSHSQPSLTDQVGRYYDFEDLDALIGTSDSMDLTQPCALQSQAGYMPAMFTPCTIAAYDPPSPAPQQSGGGDLRQANLNWAMESILPSSSVLGGAHNGARGGEDRNAQRSFLLSAVDRLIQLASLI